MSKFVTKKIEAVKGKQQFRQLVIVDDKTNVEKLQKEIDSDEREIDGELDKYEKGLEANYKNTFSSIIARMNLIANLQSLPKEKFKEITPSRESVKEYEFKQGDLRVYAIKIANGQLVVFGGFKNSQPEDIEKFRSLKKMYLKANQ